MEFFSALVGGCAWVGITILFLRYCVVRKVSVPFRIAGLSILVGLATFAGYSMLRFVILDESLQTAAGRGDLAEVRACLARGANPNALGEFGPPLQAAIRSDAPIEVVETLLRAGADPNFVDSSQEGSPLRMAVQHDRKPLADLLRRFGAR